MKLYYSNIPFLVILVLSSHFPPAAPAFLTLPRFSTPLSKGFKDVSKDVAKDVAKDVIIDSLSNVATDSSSNKNKPNSEATFKVNCEYLRDETVVTTEINPQENCKECYERDLITGVCDDSKLLCKYLYEEKLYTLISNDGYCSTQCAGDPCAAFVYPLRLRVLSSETSGSPTAPSVSSGSSSPHKLLLCLVVLALSTVIVIVL